METIVPINYIAVLAAAVLSMVIGSLWYGPLFGEYWTRQMGMKKPKTITPAIKKMMMKSYTLMFVGSLIMSCVLAHTIVFVSTYMRITGITSGVYAGFWSWLGFVAPVTLTAVLWEGKSWGMWLVNNGYYVVTLPLMGALLASWV